MNKKVLVSDSFQNDYTYELAEPLGKNYAEDFKPELTPKEMLELGVFGGSYLNDCQDARLSDHGSDPRFNFFEVSASQPLKVWQDKGWIYKDDPLGWFQWYCRYFMGRRIPEEDKRQIKRWKQMTRHIAQIKKNCYQGDLTCRRRQRQALLHWAYDSRNY